jgi:hypothetical protein
MSSAFRSGAAKPTRQCTSFPLLPTDWQGFFLLNLCVETRGSDTTVTLPPHFYGELVKTAEGAALFQSSGHLHDFLDIIKSPDAKLLNQRGALWVRPSPPHARDDRSIDRSTE